MLSELSFRMIDLSKIAVTHQWVKLLQLRSLTRSLATLQLHATESERFWSVRWMCSDVHVMCWCRERRWMQTGWMSSVLSCTWVPPRRYTMSLVRRPPSSPTSYTCCEVVSSHIQAPAVSSHHRQQNIQSINQNRYFRQCNS